MEKFDWPRMYKVEEYIEREAYNAVEEFVVDFYNVEEMMAWREEHVNEYSAMWGAFTDVYNVWEMENEL
jgi:hypothetical protein